MKKKTKKNTVKGKGKARKLSAKSLKKLKGGRGKTPDQLTNSGCGECTGCSCTSDKPKSSSTFQF